jgi:serine/threonine protein kinase/Tol biopolymer transport system component
MIGTTISHYKILEKLGEGGMGVVYKAEDLKLERAVALKFLPPHLIASEQDKARFVQEAKSASALNHPNVATVYEIDEADGQLFIAMEFVEGVTLREKMGTISAKQAIDIGIQIAEGLAAAHDKGIVHRDIKPENIMVRKDGIAQIMDFGLAKLRGASRLTKAGSTVGTAAYMSPEQVQGLDADHRSDIFSLGVLLYELFTGQLPFKGVHETALMYEIVNVDAPPMSSFKPEIDRALDAIVLECLEKDTNERAQSARQVSIDLKRFKRESTRQHVTRTVPAVEPTLMSAPAVAHAAGQAPSKRSIPLVAVSGLLVVAVIVMVWMLWRGNQRTPQPVIRFSFNVPMSIAQGVGSSPLAISPDGKYIVWLGGEGVISQLLLRPIDRMSLQPLPGTENAFDPFFSPDGQWIAAQIGGKLVKLSLFGGTPQNVCAIQGLIRGGWWAKDNTIFFGNISSGIMRVSANGGTPDLVTTLDSTIGEISDRFPQLLPDGKTVIFTIKQGNLASFNEALIAAQRIGSRERKILIHGGTYARYLPTGQLMYAHGKTLYAVPFDPDQLEVKGPPVALFDGGMLNEFSGSASYGVSENGILAYNASGPVSYDRLVMGWMDRNGRISPLINTPRPFADGYLSPDGQRLAVTIQAANDDIWVYQIKRGTLTRLTFEGGNHASPIWSPDGKYIFYSAEHGKSANIYFKPWDGSGREERLTENPEAQTPTSCSPDGKALTFMQNADIWILPLGKGATARPFIRSPAAEENAVFSPDGRFVAYTSNESGRREIYVVPLPGPGGKWQVSTIGGSNPIWARDGSGLYYLSGKKLMVVDVTLRPTFDFSPGRELCALPDSVVNVSDCTVDGKRFVVTVARSQGSTANQVNVVVGWSEELRKRLEGNK